MEPVVVKVVRPNKEVLAELCLNPRKNLGSLKVQIEGLEGTPAGNQTLLLDGWELTEGDDAVLQALGLCNGAQS